MTRDPLEAYQNYTRGKRSERTQISQKDFDCINARAVEKGQGPIRSQLRKGSIESGMS